MRLGRRRFIAITAAAATLRLLPGRPAFAGEPTRWRGDALGADASLTLYAPDPATGRRLINECLAELDRLEEIFSLYRDTSALVRLNREGRLDGPPLELVQLLTASRHYSQLSGGAFDVTVQPLWDLYASHFAQADADPHGPPETAVAAAMQLVGWHGIQIEPTRVDFHRKGMAVTLNGIAQGFVTDKVADLLRRQGLDHVLVDMGEIRALGPRPDGTPWQAAIENGPEVPLANCALSTSSPDGTRFSPWCNHIFEPASGHSSRFAGSVSVLAPTATMADALSTAICVGRPGTAAGMARHLPNVRVVFSEMASAAEDTDKRP